MNNENLSQKEASERSQLLSIDTYDVHVDLAHAGDSSISTYPTATTVRFAAKTGASTFIDYIHHSIDSVKLNGQKLNLNTVVEGSRILLENLEESNTLTIHGRSYFSRSGEGMHRFFDPSDGKVYLYTQYEPADARRVFPNFEQPDLKARFNFRITAPSHWVVSSNATLERTLEDPSDSSVSKRVFESTERISTYITTILAGEYHVAQDLYTPQATVSSGSMPLVAYCRQSLKEYFDVENIFAITKAGLDYFQDLFDYPYPYPKYEQAFVPEYNLGAMENPGMVTFTENYLFESGATQAQLEGRANVICHEMSHMWFGDLVTMKWWNDLWLKESFAEFMGTLAAQEAAGFDESWVTFANRRKAWAYTQDQLPTTHPIVADIPHLEAAKQNFDGITYAKGSAVLKQLVAYVGFDTFVQAAQLYFKKFAEGNTTLADFLAVIDEVSDRDVTLWASAWLETQGLSTLKIQRIWNDEGKLEDLKVSQQFPESTPAALGRPHLLQLGTYKLENETLQQTDLIPIDYPAGDVENIVVELNQTQKEAVETADMLVLNQEDLTYAKTILTEQDGQHIALKYVSTLSDPLTRGVIWGSLWNQVRDSSLKVESFVRSVALNISQEHSATLLSNLLAQAQTAISSYVAEAQQPPLWEFLFESVNTVVQKTEAGSDEQLTMVRALLSIAAHTSAGIDVAQKFAQGAQEKRDNDAPGFAGVPLGQSLGWTALIALSCQNAVNQDTLEAAKEVNPSAISQRGFAQALASLPLRENKELAFYSVMNDDTLSNDILSATAAGFQNGDMALHDNFSDEYFEKLLDIWANRSIVMATRIVQGLFPRVDNAQGNKDSNPVICAAREWLSEHESAPVALRRIIVEEVDMALRSLQAQEFNRQ